MSPEPIDVVFVCHPKDVRTLNLAIKGIKENGENINRVFVVSEEKLTDKAIWIDEKIYPFTKMSVALEIFNGDHKQASDFVNKPKSRIGWIYAQLLKLHSLMIIPGISSNVLVIDADTIFLNKVAFMDSDNCPLFNPGTEYYKPYFGHSERLLPGLGKVFPNYSGISHHMFFQRPVMKDFLETIERYHNIEAWRAMCRCIDHSELDYSCMADYEIYFSFIFYKTDQAKLRFLKWQNRAFNINCISRLRKEGIHYASFHTYIIKD